MKKFLFISIAILFSLCDKQADSSTNDLFQGKIVGYLKCSDSETDNTFFGIFIITNKNDSLLSFNIPSAIYDLDTNNLDYGIYFLNGDSVRFSYKNAKSEEQKVFDCPPTTMLNPTFYPIENFRQVIIIEINKIQ
ncbi:MAG: MFS transporter [Bacteroidales bacterium]|nr:MFS transporter [Saprospiraceae bacterium]MCF8380859.1 MFS transporter [Bacteroidales bacterium]